MELNEYKSQNIRHLGQISMLQNDKMNLQKEMSKLGEEVGVWKSKAEYLQSVEDDRIKAVSMVDLMEKDMLKKVADLEALQTTVDFLTEELEYSKMRNRASLDKYLRSKQNHEKLKEDMEKLQLQLGEVQEQLANVRSSSSMQEVC